MTNAPIILFCYNRPRHLEATLTALAANTLSQNSNLYVYADGAGGREQADFAAVRSLIREQHWKDSFAQVEIIEAATNLGLAESVIRGVSEVIGYCGKIIVLEDDVVVSPYFLEFMNTALQLYKADEAVGSIRAHIFDLENLPNLFFARMSGDFAWGTWERAWKRVSFDGEALLARLTQRKLTHTFDYDDCDPYTQMLRDQIAGRNSSWGCVFMLRCFWRICSHSIRASRAYWLRWGICFYGKGWSRMGGTLFSSNVPLMKIKAEGLQDAREKNEATVREEGFVLVA